MSMYPDVVALRKVRGSVTIASIDAGASVTRTVTLDDTYLIVGVPKVETENAEVELEVVNGGKNEFTFRAINTNGSSAQSDVVVNYEVYVLRGV